LWLALFSATGKKANRRTIEKWKNNAKKDPKEAEKQLEEYQYKEPFHKQTQGHMMSGKEKDRFKSVEGTSKRYIDVEAWMLLLLQYVSLGKF
jgi:hypothetical protein